MYSPTAVDDFSSIIREISIYPNPVNDLLAIQVNQLNTQNIDLTMYDINGNIVNQTTLYAGSTIAYFDTKTLYSGTYFLNISCGNQRINKKISVVK